MLTDSSIEFVHRGVNGVALVWVIDQQCLYDLALTAEHADVFLSATETIDVSAEHLEHDGVTVRFLKNGLLLDELQTSEYFGSVLLSNPLVLRLGDYPNGMYVSSPHALFVNDEFVILEEPVQ